MPTGYTASVADGTITDLAPFAMDLARGMGALVMMRDEPHDAAIPERFEPSDYYARSLSDAQAERMRLRSMTDADAAVEARQEAAEWDATVKKARAEHDAQRERYQAMIAKVEAWENAPEGIKEFGLEQLHSGMKFDCGREFKWYQDRPVTDGRAWRAAKLEKIEATIAHSASEHAKEVQRTESRNAWLDHLRRSLAQGIEAPSGGETGTGSTVGESPVGNADAP